jgi:hypothetical protein
MYYSVSKIGKRALAVTVIGLMLASVGIASEVTMFARKADAAPTCQNLAIGGVTASGYETVNPPSNANDNNLNTRWSNDGIGSWIRADLGKQQTVCSVDIAWYHGNTRTNNFVIAVSSDGTSYKQVYSGKSSGTTAAAERYSFAETTARYVRATVNGNSESTWASISEVDVNGYTLVADTTVPSIKITSPLTGSTLLQQNGKITVQGTASDNSGLQAVELRVDSGSYSAATPKAAGDWSTWSITVDVGSSGDYRLLSRATDKAGNQAWNSINISVVADAVAPSVAITSPASGSTVGTGTRAVSGTASDSSGISTVQVRLDGGSYVTATPKAAGDWSTWSTSLNIASTGSHTIYAKATDKVGNFKESSAAITAGAPDTTLPLVAITQPAANAALTSDTISVTGTSSDAGGIKTVEVSVDSGAFAAATSTGTGWSTWKATVTAASGSHTIKARATDNAGNQATNSINVSVSIPPADTTLDKFGIEKIYQTTTGGNEWYVNMADPTSDSMFRNLPSMTKQSDGSWQVSASQVRMEAWSPTDEKWQNVEITEYAKIVGGSNELLQMYSRGGHHTDRDQCLGSAYKARLYGDGDAAFVKEITHPAYAGNRGTVQATDSPLADRWVGFKAVIYNFVENGKTYVHMESYIDDDVTDSNGNLVIKNNWKLASVVEDKGGWSSSDSDFNASCFPTNKDSTHQYRQRDEIHNLPGGTSTQNIAAFRSDDLTWDWKFLSVREIVPPTS